jgi:predicted nucleic acid-binding protein
MTRVFWDTMLFIYLLEGNPQFSPRVREVLARSYERGDALLTSCLALGEVMAGGGSDRAKSDATRETIAEMGFSFLPFEPRCVDIFSRLRSEQRLKAPDSINLASAGASGVDVFLTGDLQLLKRGLHVPGIHIVADFNLPIL